jgi:soluble lytic murein transglycosylase-like protein
MQVMPRTAEEMGIPRERLAEPEFNIAAGAAYVAHLFQAAWRKYKLKGVRYHEAPLWLKQRIIAAYNAGPKFLFRHGGWFRQTRDYVRKVLLFYHSPVTDFRRGGSSLERGPLLPVSASGGALL